jgi:hypothetical protein
MGDGCRGTAREGKLIGKHVRQLVNLRPVGNRLQDAILPHKKPPKRC